MWTFDNTFAEEIAALINQWDNFCPAAALFYWGKNSNDTGLRIEATEIMREFVDNIQFGRGLFSVTCFASYWLLNIGIT